MFGLKHVGFPEVLGGPGVIRNVGHAGRMILLQFLRNATSWYRVMIRKSTILLTTLKVTTMSIWANTLQTMNVQINQAETYLGSHWNNVLRDVDGSSTLLTDFYKAPPPSSIDMLDMLAVVFIASDVLFALNAFSDLLGLRLFRISDALFDKLLCPFLRDPLECHTSLEMWLPDAGLFHDFYDALKVCYAHVVATFAYRFEFSFMESRCSGRLGGLVMVNAEGAIVH